MDIDNTPTTLPTGKATVQALKYLKEGYMWQMGNGDNTSVWYDKWVGDFKLKYYTDDVTEEMAGMKVKHLIKNHFWDLSPMSTSLNEDLLNSIKAIPMSSIYNENDKYV